MSIEDEMFEELDLDFNIGDIVKNEKTGDIGRLTEVDFLQGGLDFFVQPFESGKEGTWCSSVELPDEDIRQMIQESKNNKENESHKGCEFVNNDFYRSFTNKNGSVVFNKVKVSTLCFCKRNDEIYIATINNDKRLKPGTKVRLDDDAMATVTSCIKIMDKYIDDLIRSITVDKRGSEVLCKITGIYNEKEVTKTITETELVLEEI